MPTHMHPAFSPTLILALISAMIFWTAPSAVAQQVPQVLGYQGRVSAGGVNIDGNAQFKFALVNGATNDVLWSNDGSVGNNVVPNTFVTLNVAKGLYSVRLGDTALVNMAAIPASVFNNPDVRLRVWVNGGAAGFQLLSPDQRLSAVAYALAAGTTQTLAPGIVGSAQLAGGLTLGGTTTGNFAGVIGSGATVTTGAVVTGTNLANAATEANTVGTLVKRDAGGNFMVGTITFSSGINLPATSSSSVGVIMQGGSRLIHTFGGATNFFGGIGAGNFAMTGGSNTALGGSTLVSNTTGSSNLACGSKALYSNTTGGNNTATGDAALYSNTAGSNNTAGGVAALYSNTTGNSNTASGVSSLRNNTTGSNNTASGVSALQNNTTAGQNTAFGDSALLSQSFDNANVTWSSNNTAVGFQALKFNQPVSTFNGVNNTAVGANTLRANTTGSGNRRVACLRCCPTRSPMRIRPAEKVRSRKTRPPAGTSLSVIGPCNFKPSATPE